jgi:outer membrane protein TolC
MIPSKQNQAKSPWITGCNWLAIGLLTVLLAGCKGLAKKSEKRARQDFQAVQELYRPIGQTNVLPQLTEQSGLSNFLAYAMLNQPKVEAVYFDWLASVERITVQRSLPDPRFTFWSDIRDVISTVMLGLGQEFPGPGKLGARADVASAESNAKYYQFEIAVLQAAFDFKRAYYQLYFLAEKIRITQETLELLKELEQIARSQNEAGKVTLQDVLRAQIEQDRTATGLENLEDSRNPLLAQFKAALGLQSGEPNPPVPTQFESTPLDVQSEHLFELALSRNPRLKAIEAEVRMADAGIRLARKSKVPDYNLGIGVDVKSSPTMVRPQAGVTLPIWRDKITAEIAAAQARKQSVAARLTNEQILLAVDFADKMFSYRESVRNLELLQQRLIPKARLSLDVARAGYLSGQINFFNLIDAERTLLDFQLSEVEENTRRELVLADLSLLITGIAPEGAPLPSETAGSEAVQSNNPPR